MWRDFSWKCPLQGQSEARFQDYEVSGSWGWVAKNSPSDVVVDTQETLKTIAKEPDVVQCFKTTKQVGVYVELWKNSPIDVVADTQETFETTIEEP